MDEFIRDFVGDIKNLGPLKWTDNWEESDDRLEALEAIVKEHEEAMEVTS